MIGRMSLPWFAAHFAAELVIMCAALVIAWVKFRAANRISNPIGQMILRLLGACTLSFGIKAIVIAITTWAETWELLITMELITAAFLACASVMLLRLAAAWGAQ